MIIPSVPSTILDVRIGTLFNVTVDYRCTLCLSVDVELIYFKSLFGIPFGHGIKIKL